MNIDEELGMLRVAWNNVDSDYFEQAVDGIKEKFYKLNKKQIFITYNLASRNHCGCQSFCIDRCFNNEEDMEFYINDRKRKGIIAGLGKSIFNINK
jgi:hypothetical protein